MIILIYYSIISIYTMSFTRFYDDPSRIQKQMEISTYLGRYQLDRPGQGVNLPFSEDPHIRLQGWGANLRRNTVNLESDLRGLTRKLNRDNTDQNNYLEHSVLAEKVDYRVESPYVDESRASLPAWTFRDLEQTRWEEPFINPQAKVELPFNWNIQTRILEKDTFEQKARV
jgi:hypothetical protein